MRLKQLLGVLIVLLLAGPTWAAVPSTPTSAAHPLGATAQLTNVSVVGQGSSTTVTLHANGSYTHNEYRPADNSLLIDLTGVSAGRLQGRSKMLEVPGVKGYRVLGYKAADGAEIARVELTLASGAQVQVNETKAGLALKVTAPEAATANPNQADLQSAAPAPTQDKPATTGFTESSSKTPAITPTSALRASGTPAQVESVNVVPDKDNVRVIAAVAGEVTPEVMTLRSPDRLVIDLPNAILQGSQGPIEVNAGEVKGVRLSRFRNEPPTTRIVVDLRAPAEYGVEQAGSKLIIKIQSSPTGAPDTTPVSAASEISAEPQTSTAGQLPATPVEVAKLESPEKPETKVADSAKPVVALNVPPAKPVDTAPSPDSKPAVNNASSFAYVEPTASRQAESKSNAAAEVMASNPTRPAEQTIASNQTPSVTPPSTAPSSQQAGAPAAPSTTGVRPQKAINFAAEQVAEGNQSVTGLPRYTGEPISVNLKDVDIKDFFRLIHEISGLNLVLDPAISGNLTLVLDDVPWDQALDIVLRNNGLDRQLDGNVLRVARIDTLRKEAEAKAAERQAQALAVDKGTVTRFLSYAHAKDVMPTIKKMLSARGDVIADERTNAIIIQDIPSVMPAIDTLIRQLDRKTQQVEIEARVVAATRTFARDIGVQLGFGWGNSPSAVGGATGVGASPIIDKVPNAPQYIVTGTNQIPLFSNLGVTAPTSGLSFLNATNAYRVDAILTAAESRGLLKILSRPRVVTQNNIQAVVKQGVRIPIVTQAQLGGPPTVAYIDAMLKLTVTPQITAESTIFLNVDVENTTPDFSQEIQGNPTLITQQATTQVLVTDGGTVVIGGVVQTNNTVNILQTPVLGNVPVLGNLFKRRTVKTQTQELIFFITPKIAET